MIDMKIGVGIITCDRISMFEKCYNSIKNISDIDELVVVNDGGDSVLCDHEMIRHVPPRQGVAKSKNDALQHLLDKGCDHLFLIEDDMLIKDPSIFQKYIETSKVTGIQHLMFGYHGPANKNGVSGGSPCPRIVVDYGEHQLALNPHCVGAFCYYTRESLEDVGLIDERFRNAFDHVSHSYSLALKGYSTPYWWWSDVANSLDYIEEQECSEKSSSIKTEDQMHVWETNIQKSMDLFRDIFGVMPFGNDGVKDTPEIDVLKFLKSKR